MPTSLLLAIATTAGVAAGVFLDPSIVAVANWLAALLALPQQMHAATVVVGPADGSCPGAIFGRIQSAIDAAVPGTTIVACAGSYVEQLVVTKRIRLLAAPGARLVPPALHVVTTSPRTGRPVAAAISVAIIHSSRWSSARLSTLGTRHPPVSGRNGRRECDHPRPFLCCCDEGRPSVHLDVEFLGHEIEHLLPDAALGPCIGRTHRVLP